MPMSPRLLRPRASATVAFSPASISGLEVWLDPSVASSLTIQTGVSEWRNLAARGGNVLQTVANNQPTLTNASSQPALINGRQALFFDGTNDSLSSGGNTAVGNALTGSQGFSIYAVVSPATTSYRDILWHSSFGVAAWAASLAHDTRLRGAVGYQGTGERVSSTTSFSVSTPVVAATRYTTVGGPTSAGFVNRNTVLARATAGGTANATASQNGQLQIGFNFVNFSGLFGETLTYSRDVSDAEHSAIVNYLMAKWGIP